MKLHPFLPPEERVPMELQQLWFHHWEESEAKRRAQQSQNVLAAVEARDNMDLLIGHIRTNITVDRQYIINTCWGKDVSPQDVQEPTNDDIEEELLSQKRLMYAVFDGLELMSRADEQLASLSIQRQIGELMGLIDTRTRETLANLGRDLWEFSEPEAQILADMHVLEQYEGQLRARPKSMNATEDIERRERKKHDEELQKIAIAFRQRMLFCIKMRQEQGRPASEKEVAKDRLTFSFHVRESQPLAMQWMAALAALWREVGYPRKQMR